jgi:PknH-like extracellular domain
MRAALAIGCIVGVVMSAGCTRTVSGAAEYGTAGEPTSLREVLLPADEINDVIGTTGMEVIETSEEMSDNSSFTPDTECLGALYHSEETVYDGTGWEEVVDQIVSTPEYDGQHWMEQTAVRLPSPAAAEDFADQSMLDWTNCIGQRVVVDDEEGVFAWRFEGVAIDGSSVAQTVRSDDDDGGPWRCRHVLRPESDVVVEVSVCGETLNGEAETIAERIADRVD